MTKEVRKKIETKNMRQCICHQDKNMKSVKNESEMLSECEFKDYLCAIKKAIREWKSGFKNYDINDYLYNEEENIVYGMMEKFYMRIRNYKRRIPKKWKINGLPSLRKLSTEWMCEDSDMHLSDYEFAILFPMQNILKKYEEENKKGCV